MALRCVTARASSGESTTFPSMRGAAVNRSSTALSALRTSPPQPCATSVTTSSGQSVSTLSRPASSRTARRTAPSASRGEIALNSNTVLRERTALYT